MKQRVTWKFDTITVQRWWLSPGPCKNLEGNQHVWLSCQTNMDRTADNIDYSMESKCNKEQTSERSESHNSLIHFLRRIKFRNDDPRTKQWWSTTDKVCMNAKVSTKEIPKLLMNTSINLFFVKCPCNSSVWSICEIENKQNIKVYVTQKWNS